MTKGVKVDDIITINNLKHAWMFILDTINYPSDYALLCKIHSYVGSNLIYNPGFIRTVPVSIGGTTWNDRFEFMCRTGGTCGNNRLYIGRTPTDFINYDEWIESDPSILN